MDRELIKIVNAAIPLSENCAIKKKQEILRRAFLMEDIKKYTQAQLEKQFNAKQAV